MLSCLASTAIPSRVDRMILWLSYLHNPPLVMHVCISESGQHWFRSALVQIMACRLFGAKPLPEPMLDYCQLDTWNKFQWNLNQNTKFFIHENASVNIVCKKAAILSRGRWVKESGSRLKLHIAGILLSLNYNILSVRGSLSYDCFYQ